MLNGHGDKKLRKQSAAPGVGKKPSEDSPVSKKENDVAAATSKGKVSPNSQIKIRDGFFYETKPANVRRDVDRDAKTRLTNVTKEAGEWGAYSTALARETAFYRNKLQAINALCKTGHGSPEILPLLQNVAEISHLED